MSHELGSDILNNGLFQLEATPPTTVHGHSPQFQIFLDTPLTFSVDQISIQGNIVINVSKTMKNRDFHLQFKGCRIIYSNNPYKMIDESDRSIARHQSVSQFVSDILNHSSKRQIETEINEEEFLEGEQVIKYASSTELEEEIEIETLSPGTYYIPFSFLVPKGTPPSIGMIGFSNMFFTIQYKIVVQQFLTQPIVLEREKRSNQIEQFLCTTLQIFLSKYCFICLGDYCLEGIIRIVFNNVHVKLQFYRKGEKSGNQPLIQEIKVGLVAEIVNVGKHVIAEERVTLQQLEYGIKGREFMLCDLNKLRMKSYSNQIFELRYYLDLQPITASGVRAKVTKRQKHFIPI